MSTNVSRPIYRNIVPSIKNSLIERERTMIIIMPNVFSFLVQ